MADESEYPPSGLDSTNNKRKYDGQTTAPSSGRRTTGFSAPIASQSPDSGQMPPSYNNMPAVDEIQIAKQRAQEIAARLFNNAEPKRSRVENGASGFDSNEGKGFTSGAPDLGLKPMYNAAPSMPTSYGYPSLNKKIEIPNGRVGVIIGKGGETIKYLQLQSGAKIQVTRDMDADPNSQTRAVELMGTSEQMAKAEQLITEVLSEAESGGPGVVSRRVTGQPGGSEQYVMKVPTNKVGLIIGKGGETIKSMQATTGARIQVIPLHVPPGDTSTERTVQIDGTNEQIEAAKQLVDEVISENRGRNPMGGGYQQGYQTRLPTSWTPPNPQPGYGYAQQGSYPSQPQYNNMTPQSFGGYPPQPISGGCGTSWDPSSATNTQQTTPGGGYDYYGQQQAPAQQQTPGAATAAPSGTNTAYGYSQGQGYSQDGYGGYQASGAQSGYGQPSQQGYDNQQEYNSTLGYGNVGNQTSERQAPSYGDSSQAPQQQGYTTTSQNPSSNLSFPVQGGATQLGYGVPPASGYGSQPHSGYAPPAYGTPPIQKPPAYGQPQQSPTAQAGYGQPEYGHSQPPPPQSGYGQTDSGAQQAPPSGYSTGTAQVYGAQSGYGGPQYCSSYASGYAPRGSAAAAAAPPSQATTGAVQASGAAKASP